MDIAVHDLVKRFGEHFSLQIPGLYIAPGETVGLVGNNGAGKTTFLRLLLDLLRADEGRVCIGGVDVARDGRWKLETGSYLDESFLLDFLTADEFFDFVGSVYGLSRDEIRERLVPYRSFFTDQVMGQRSKYIRDLSKGNAKKVGIVAALLVRPRLLILDEPFAMLDPGSQIRLKGILREVNQTRGTTLLISSHDLIHVTEICKRIVVVNGGRILRDFATSEASLRELEQFFAGAADGDGSGWTVGEV